MHAVVTRSTIRDLEEARKALKDEGVPRVSQAPGFVGAHWVSLDGNNGASMLVFESEETAKAAAEQIRAAGSPAGSAVTVDSVEVGEVVAHA